MKRYWFKEWGWIYLPVSWQGWAAVAFTLAFCTHIFLAADRHSHSVSDTLYGIFPYVVPAMGILVWVASRTAARPASVKE